MKPLKSKSMSLLLTMLEVIAVARNPERSWFSPLGFKLYQVFIWTGHITLVISCSAYLLYEKGDKNMTVMILSVTLEFSICRLLLMLKKEDIRKMINANIEVLQQLEPNSENRRQIDFVDGKSFKFMKVFITLINLNIMIGVLQAIMKTWLTGQTSFPFDASCLGLPVVPCWILQIPFTTMVAVSISSYLTILKIVTFQLRGFAEILSRMIRDRPVDDEERNDRNILKLYSGFLKFSTLYSKVFGATAFVEIVLSTVRSCFQSYHVITASSNDDWANATRGLVALTSSIFLTYMVCSCGKDMDEMGTMLKNGSLDSEWHKCTLLSRKRFLHILVLNQAPIKFHYRHYMRFDMEMLNQVLSWTYSLITAMTNFIDT